MESIMNAIRAVRNRRAEMNVPPSKKSTLYVTTAKKDVFEQGAAFITRLAYADQVILCDAAPEGHEDMVSCVTADAEMFIPMNQLVDIEKELERIARELEKARKNLQSIEGKLGNANFVSRAPENVVNAERAKAEKARALIAQLEESEKRLKK